MMGYEKVPHALSANRSLTVGARALYPTLRRLAWDAGRRKPQDAVELPTVEAIADELGCAVSTCRTYVAELRAAGWVETVRASRRRPSLWIIRDDPSAPKSGARNRAESAEKDAPSAPNFGAHTSSLTDEANGETTSPPSLTLIEGRNLALDTLLEECGMDPKTPRMGQAVAALNGTARPRKPGIRDLFWEEACRYADEHGERDRLAEVTADPERFEQAVAEAIRRKAGRYRRALPGAILSPTALRDWWLDLERRSVESAGATADEIRRFARA